jgi:hypothetical protein
VNQSRSFIVPRDFRPTRGLALPQRLGRLNPQSPSKRIRAGEQAHRNDEGCDGDDETRAVTKETVRQRERPVRRHKPNRETQRGTGADLPECTPEDVTDDSRGIGAERGPDADLTSALRDREGHHGVDTRRRKQEDSEQEKPDADVET